MIPKWKSILSDRRLLRNGILIGAIWFGVTWWQTRDLVPTETPAAPLPTASLSGPVPTLEEHEGKRVLLYFFAPWCSVCAVNISNLDWLRKLRSEEHLAIYAVALDYQSPDELEAYVQQHELTVPVLLGTRQTWASYRVQAFPTVYALDESGHIESRAVGYVPLVGLWWRSL